MNLYLPWYQTTISFSGAAAPEAAEPDERLLEQLNREQRCSFLDDRK